MTIKELREKRAKVIAGARAMLDAADQEGRDLTTEEQTAWDARMAEADTLKGQIDRRERLDSEERALGAHQPTIAGRQDTAEGDEGEVRAADEGGTAVATRGDSPYGTEEYRGAFWHQVRQGRGALFPPEVRSLNTGTDAEGGFVVPESFETRLLAGLEQENVMRRLGTVITTTSDQNIPVEADIGDAAWIAEEAPYPIEDVLFLRRVLGAHKLGRITKVSEEFLQDAFFDVETYLNGVFARVFGRKEEEAMIAGDGVGKPLGVAVDATAGVTAASATAVTADELINLFHALPRPYRPRATWLFADSTALAMRKVKDSTGQYIWQPGLQAGQPDRLLGRPVESSQYSPAMAAAAVSVLFGDFSYYWIADRLRRTMQRLNELYAATGQIGFKGYERVDGKLILPEAVVKLTQAAV